MKWLRVLAGSAALLCACSLQAQELILKVHHPLPPSSTAHQKVLEPWCAKIGAESKNRIKCQIYPSMQLGGSVPQLYDQVKDGVVDVIWTVAGYSAGRFPLVEVFELPFFMKMPNLPARRCGTTCGCTTRTNSRMFIRLHSMCTVAAYST